LPDKVRRALELRIEGGKSSVEKIAGMLRSVTKDGTIKGVFLHHGAGQSGRFSSRGGVQVHNMPRPRKIFEDAHLDRSVLFDLIRSSDPEVLTLVYGHELGRPLHLLADALRSFIWAAPNHRFIGADFASIEGRITAWYGRDEWKLQAYRDSDAGHGHGLYEMAAAGIYGIPVENVTKQQRQVGKVAELACVAEDTLVLTHNGAKRIVEVTTDDLLWDGVEWVNHQGIVVRGQRATINVCGINATPDHLFLAGTKWLRASLIASRKYPEPNAGDRFGFLTVIGVERIKIGACMQNSVRVQCDCGAEPHLVADYNLRNGKSTRCPVCARKSAGFWRKDFYKYASVCPDDDHRRRLLNRLSACKTDATTRKTADTQTTVVGASRFMNLGWPTSRSFSNTSCSLKGGINPTTRVGSYRR
jgi:hypothetical protein